MKIKRIGYWKNNFWRRLIGIPFLIFIGIPVGIFVYQTKFLQLILWYLYDEFNTVWKGASSDD